MTTTDIAKLRDLLSRATAGEWLVDYRTTAHLPWSYTINPAAPQIDEDEAEANAALIAAAKNSMAALLDAYEERERLARATASCEGEQEHFEKWAKGHGLDMHEHPLHYLFLDPRTSAARAAWKAALEYVRRAALQEPSHA